MNLSWRWKAFLASSVGVGLALLLVTTLMGRVERSWLIARDVRDLTRSAHHAVQDLGDEARRGTLDPPAAAARLGQSYERRVTLIDASGRVLGDSDVRPENLPNVENHGGRPEVKEALQGRPGSAIRSGATVGEPFLYVAVPSPGAGPIAVVRVAEPLSVFTQVNDSLLRLFVLFAALTMIVLLVVLFWLSGRQGARVAELERTAARLGRGDLAARALERPADELGRLGRAMNTMAAETRGRLEALAHERDEREHILTHMSDGVALVDTADRVVHSNRRMAEILGSPPPAAGTPLAAFVRSPGLEELVGEARHSDRPVETELRLWMPRPRMVRASATRLEAGGRDAVLLVLHDLTEIELLARVRQEFVANVSHELRTPLTSIRGYAETLLEGGLDDRDHREGFVGVIREQAERLTAIIDDLLSLAELERPGSTPRREPFDLREVAGRQVAAARERAEKSGLALVLAPGPPVPLEADARLIEQVLANLLDNAVKYTERGEIEVRMGSSGGRAWCEVEDTGPGIPQEDQPRIFERFYRVDKARSREKGGTGLGLSIVKHIVLLHGGTVSVKSQLGQGATFRFEIPLS
ncbi:MAG TPA: ATP-binding protein [Candidatus Eisenbacteria bacterium]|nr:ATP-binding protein [Candidatus Eisenbacteria bacterium]